MMLVTEGIYGNLCLQIITIGRVGVIERLTTCEITSCYKKKSDRPLLRLLHSPRSLGLGRTSLMSKSLALDFLSLKLCWRPDTGLDR